MNKPKGEKEKRKGHRTRGGAFLSALHGGNMPDILQKAAQAYRNICKRRYCYTFSNGQEIQVIFKPQNFAHLAGLRKLNDVHEFQATISAVNLYKSTLAGKTGIYDAQRSVHFDTEVRERIENLCRLEYLLQTKQVVWGFDKRIAPVQTKLKSTVIFFRDDGYNFYLLLGAAKDGESYYPETFFLRYDSAYIRAQNIISVTQLKVCAAQ